MTEERRDMNRRTTICGRRPEWSLAAVQISQRLWPASFDLAPFPPLSAFEVLMGDAGVG
jgi:hypothetical protein